MKYWNVSETGEVNQQAITAHRECGVYHVPTSAITFTPKPPKDGFAVILTPSKTGTVYIEDHRNKVIYNKSTQEPRTQELLGAIDEQFTLLKPQSSFDEWDGYQWVTNVRDQYVFNYNDVDNRRRRIYSQSVDPLMKEREIKLSQAEILESEGNIAEAENKRQEAKDYQIRALQLREKIQRENPYPINPDA
ncbi:hypothetical protein [Photobacterium leiognathi]|uniref:hypothetical protein n=1 Tax=Photobacterium leiognathi TaxID=553611 RepID=UPI00020880D3|nr:hypothetical protein [Photobacterium leiognathi]PSW48330.1 hypothetical protein CTM83_20060 [Photobacterium leiognathi subsp. mandapamensis]GAA03235.1 putative uncharacterized protein [Photobacterium leiognathi subsp. mandapamensis svers.1.1.]